MRTVTYVQRKCDSCGAWIDAKPIICPECGGPVDLRKVEQQQKQAAKEAEQAYEKALLEAKPWPIRTVIKIGQTAQLVFMAIVSFFAWLIFWIGG